MLIAKTATFLEFLVTAQLNDSNMKLPGYGDLREVCSVLHSLFGDLFTELKYELNGTTYMSTRLQIMT